MKYDITINTKDIIGDMYEQGRKCSIPVKSGGCGMISAAELVFETDG